MSPQAVNTTEFRQHDLRGRVAFIRKYLSDLEKEWGTIDQWSTHFLEGWRKVRVAGFEVTQDWLRGVECFVEKARQAVYFMKCLMDEDEHIVFASLEECRDAWLEMYHLSLTVLGGVVGLENKLEFALFMIHL